ncbi:hypothetical protein [Candidatus Regiella insecticola]|uniref:hypothetical protein n=1 Tax=Candidatus Regiella insecticola TaxID=138073 RepID=UPI0015967091|nr:hypothetical protein [Candidatus Regiella insecticola]
MDNFAKTLLKVEKLVTTIATVAITVTTVTITTAIVATVIVIATAATVILDTGAEADTGGVLINSQTSTL